MAPVRAHGDGFPGATAPDETSDLLRFLLDSMAEGVLRLDAGLRIVAANPAACALLGRSRQELLGRPLNALFPSAPRDAEALLALSRQAGALLRGERKDGSACEAQLALHCPPAGGAEAGFVLLLRDVTQRARRERRLVEQQQFLRQVIDAIPNFIFVKNADGAYALANESFARQYGLSADELIGRGDADVVPNPELVRRFLDEDRDVLGLGREVFIPEHPIMVDGARRWIQSIKRPLRIGEETQVLGVITDITARKEAEERLRESEAWHRSIIAALEEAVIVQDAGMRIVDCNPGAERMIGLPAERMLGLEMGRDTWRSIREDGSPFPYDEQPAIITLRTGQPQTNVLMGIYRPDGTPRWISINTQPLLLPGQDQPSAVVSSFFDVTERRQADRDLQLQRDFALQVMTAMGQGLTVTDRSGRFTFVNPAYAAMLGVSPAELIGVSPFDLVHPDDRAELQAAYERRLRGETTSYQARLLRNSQPPVNVLITGVPRWIEGRVEGSIAVVTDLTEPKRLEAALAQARDRALEASQLKSQFVANMSHEIRTPMNGIIGIVDLLLAAQISDEQQELVGIIRDSAHALLTILDDILDFSKIEAGRLELERASFQVAEVIEGTIDLLAARAREKRIELVALLAPELAGPLWGDPGRLRQILVNLVGNAVKFTQRGEVIVSVACEELTDEGARLRFSVADTGIGLSATARERLFQAFAQADSSTTRLYGGTGLGLSIAQRLVGMMGGEIGVESVEGRGSTFWFTVTLERDRDWVAPPAATPQPGRRALLVTDHEPHRAMLSQALAAAGFEIVAAADAESALAALAPSPAGSPELALVSLLGEPGLGWRLAPRLLAASEPAPRLLVLTSFEELAGVDPGLLERLGGYMVRPVKPSALQRALAQAGGQPAAGPAAAPGDPLGAAPAAPVRVLIVEDNPVNQQVVRLHLQKLGYQTAMAQDGEEAVAAVASSPYDLILMDCQMPRMDGFTATRRIREAERSGGGHVPIVAMTAHAMAGDREACLAAGMDDYLSKPITAAVLRATLFRWLPAPAAQPPAPAEPPPPAGLTPAELDGAVLEGLRELNSDDEPDIVTMLIDIFFNSAPALLGQIREQAARQDGPGLEIAAHSLKGSASNLGARELARLCKDLEYAGRDKRFELIAAQLAAAEREFARVRLALERERQPAEDSPPAT